ncbi:hypothetical protein, partial [Escherichia coli]|uniref:hypothetical protein n=1 Tax=Escherichia coli TaxID=562 RepID=UPI001BDC7AA3
MGERGEIDGNAAAFSLFRNGSVRTGAHPHAPGRGDIARQRCMRPYPDLGLIDLETSSRRHGECFVEVSATIAAGALQVSSRKPPNGDQLQLRDL